jgi:streptogramin lyase
MRVIHFGPVWQANRRERVQGRRASWLACLAVLAAALLGCVVPQVASAESGLSTGLGASTEPGASAEPEVSLTPSTTKPYTLCPPGGRMIECNLIIDPPPVETSAGLALPGGGPLLEGGGEKGGFDPENLQAAYKIPTSGGSEETVALVDAYGYKAAESDLAKYRAKYKLAACTKASGCFKQVNEKGEEKNYPAEGGGLEVEWSLETALDMDMVSAACPNCKIMLVEATTQGPADTGASAEEAAKLKASEISNSYGYPENNETWCPSKNGCKEYLSDYNHAGIPVTVSSGDSGYDDGVGAPSWPAASPNVIAVGGTSLKKAEGSRGWSETVWSGSGSGCSLYEAKPTWQTDKGCTKRTDNDVAAVASPSTPVSIYNTPYAGGWFNVGGTSVSSPFVAGVEAHATSATKKLAADAFYKKPSMLFDVTSGSNGTCTPPAENEYLCTAKVGYDGPTGWGTPDGVFTSGPVAVTEAATSITTTGATLNGSVNPEGAETKYYFEYDTKEYKEGEGPHGTKTAEATAGSGTSSVKESKAITGLTAGKQYDFRIVATNSSSETSDGANKVFTTLPNAPENTVLPVISPTTPVEGEPESTTNGTWTNSPTGYAYQWELCNATGGECANISGATSSTFTPVEADVEHTLVVKVTAKNSGGEGSALSKATNKVQLPAAPENTVLPVASPVTPDQAVPESTTTGTWTNSPTGYAYQWELCNATGGECANISGATSSTFTPVEADVEHTLVVKVTAKNSGGEGSALSKATNKVQPIGVITEYASTGGHPYGIARGPDGNLWYTDFGGSNISKITTSGTNTEYALPETSDPYGITAGPDGNLWYVDTAFVGELQKNKIGKITTSGTITEYALPEKSYPYGITAGPEKENALWFVDTDTSKIGKITTSGVITEYALPEKSYPGNITAGPDGNLWFTDNETSKIGKITTSGVITEYALPTGSYPEGITAGPDGNLWFTDITTGKIGKITTSGVITEYALPKESQPYGIALGPDGNLWYADYGTSKIGRITTSGTITEYSLPKGSGPVTITVGPDDNMWFTNYSSNKIGKITP